MVTGTRDSFGDWSDEARTIRAGIALVELDHLAILRVRGRDARDFLHRMTSADLKQVRDERAIPAALLTPKARVICSLTLVPRSGELLCILSRDHRDAVRAYLERFIIADDVELTDGQQALLGIYGAALEQSTELGHLAQLEAYRLAETTLMQTDCLAIGDDHLATLGAQIVLRPPERAQLVDLLEHAGAARRVGWRAYDSCRVEAGTPLMGRELSEEVLILEAGQLVAVSFDKGCYPGQEPVCRIQNRGQVNRRLVGLRLGTSRVPALGERLRHPDKESAGWITSAAQSVHLRQQLGLGYVHRRLATPGTTLQLDHGGDAVVAALPHVGSDVWPLTCPRYKDADHPA